MNDLIFYINGDFVPASEAGLPLNDLGIVRGYGVFDVLRTYGHLPFRLREHVQRLERSAALIEIDVPWSTAEIEEIVHETLARNSLPDVSVRLILTGGQAEDLITPGEQPSLVVMVKPAPVDPSEIYGSGSSAITVEMERFLPSVKSLNYITAIMAQKRAKRVGAIEALYKDAAGNVTEGTTTSFCIFRGNTLVAPQEGVLDGITRNAVLDLAANYFEIAREPIPYASLREVDEAFITSTTKDIAPLLRIDDIEIGSAESQTAPGPNTLRLLDLFKEHVRSLAEEAAFGFVQTQPVLNGAETITIS